MNKKSLLVLIVVGLLSTGILIKLKSANCFQFPDDKKLACVKDRLDGFIAANAFSSGLSYLNDYDKEDRVFSSINCHPLTHYLGEKAFAAYKQGTSLDFSDLASICNYGFYHAFMTNFALNGNLPKAREFCDQLELISTSAANSCYHGLGHGVIYFYNEELGMNRLEEMLQQGVSLCEQVFPGETAKTIECLGGFYGGLADVAFREDSRYGDLSPATLYGLCGSQPEVYQPICYRNVSQIVFVGNDQDFASLVNFIVNNSQIKYKKEAIGGLAAIFIGTTENDLTAQQQGLAVCQNLPIELKNECLEMMSTQLFYLSSHKARRDLVDEFCALGGLNAVERRVCLFGENAPLRQEFLSHDSD